MILPLHILSTHRSGEAIVCDLKTDPKTVSHCAMKNPQISIELWACGRAIEHDTVCWLRQHLPIPYHIGLDVRAELLCSQLILTAV